ncbi:MAG TPA: hypothetical protein VGF79_03565 [Bacteroidia bacterium]
MKYLPIFLLTFFLSSCFEFIEEVTYNDDQSGVCQLTINGSQSQSKLDALFNMDSFLGVKIPNRDQINREIDVAIKALEESKGINNINHHLDFHNYIFNIKFSFDSTHHLNEALNNVSKAVARKNSLPEYTVYSFKDNLFQRLTSEGDSIVKAQGLKKRVNMLEGATATSIYRFHKTVKSVSNKQAKISKSGKAVMLKMKITDIINNHELFANTIKLQ